MPITWKDFDAIMNPYLIFTSVTLIAIIWMFVARRCEAIARPGYDCGIGIGWFIIAGVLVVIGVISTWQTWRIMRERSPED